MQYPAPGEDLPVCNQLGREAARGGCVDGRYGRPPREHQKAEQAKYAYPNDPDDDALEQRTVSFLGRRGRGHELAIMAVTSVMNLMSDQSLLGFATSFATGVNFARCTASATFSRPGVRRVHYYARQMANERRARRQPRRRAQQAPQVMG
jgi:hypothetical protein